MVGIIRYGCLANFFFLSSVWSVASAFVFNLTRRSWRRNKFEYQIFCWINVSNKKLHFSAAYWKSHSSPSDVLNISQGTSSDYPFIGNDRRLICVLSVIRSSIYFGQKLRFSNDNDLRHGFSRPYSFSTWLEVSLWIALSVI